MKRSYPGKSYQRKDGGTSYYPNRYSNQKEGDKEKETPAPAGPSVTITLPPGQQQAFSFQMVINPVNTHGVSNPGQQTNIYPNVPPLPSNVVNAGPKTLVPLQVVSVPATEKRQTSLFDLMQQKAAQGTNNNNNNNNTNKNANNNAGTNNNASDDARDPSNSTPRA